MLAKLHSILTKPKVWVEPRELLGTQFAVVCAETGERQEPDWAEVEWLAQTYSRWILLPDSLAEQFSSSSRLRAFDCRQFDREVFINTACSLIHRTRMPMYRRVLGLLDEDGGSADMLYQLLKYYTSVKVVTRNLPRYRDAAQQMMEELGAPVLVNSSLSSLSDCVLILSPGQFSSQEDVRMPCPILTPSESHLQLKYRCQTITRLQAALPGDAKPPQGISSHLFAAALYTLCDLDAIEPLACNMLFCHQYTELNQVVLAIRQNAGVVL